MSSFFLFFLEKSAGPENKEKYPGSESSEPLGLPEEKII